MSAPTARVRVGGHDIELSQPLRDRPHVIVVTTDDGRRCVLGDGAAFGPEPVQREAQWTSQEQPA